MNFCRLGGLASLVALAYLQPFRPVIITGTSMAPTLRNGQARWALVRPQSVSRGDVVVFRRGSETCVKRVLLVQGDSLRQFQFGGEWVIARNRLVEGSMIRHSLPQRTEVVPTGSVFVVGDNLDESIDSRSYGPIEDSTITEKLINPPPIPFGRIPGQLLASR